MGRVWKVLAWMWELPASTLWQQPGVHPWQPNPDLLPEARRLVTMTKDIKLACTHDTYRY